MFRYKDTVGAENTDVSLSAYIKRLKKIQAFLRTQYRQTIEITNRTYMEQVLFDNYYIVDNKIKLLLKNTTRAKLYTSNGHVPQVGQAVLSYCKGNNLAETGEICAVLAKIQAERYISNAEFELLEWAFSYAVISGMTDAFLEENGENAQFLTFITLLVKSDMIAVEDIIVRQNTLERLYASEPLGVYARMDDATRRIYRERTAYIARKTGVSELELAKDFLAASQKAYDDHLPGREAHIGHAIYQKYQTLKKGTTPSAYTGLLGGIPLVFALLLSVLMKNLWFLFLAYLPLWEICKPFIDFFVTVNKEPTYLPRMNLNGHIPEDAPTMVLVSTILTTPTDTLKIKDKLKELYYLNQTPNLVFCMLCDFKPSDMPKMPEDKVLKKNVAKIIADLDRECGPYFAAVVRERTFSHTEGKYIGFERKRGAIAQLVHCMNGKNPGGLAFFGNKDALLKSRYIAALDYDTKPLLDSVAELVSIALHPLNTPSISSGIVTKGYGIFTPRMATNLSSSLKTPFARLFGGLGSSSAYDTLCGNLYQDCFHEGIFSGKGLIDAKIFYELCCDYFPNDTVLSHDILEGNLMRTAFVGDVEFRDSFPASTMSYFKRLHRWIRGDIQNAPYYSKNVPTAQSKNTSNPVTRFNRFKLLDNIRRSVTPVFVFLLFFISGFFPVQTARLWVLLGLFAILIPFVVGIVASVVTNGSFSLSRKYYSTVLSETKSLIAQAFYAFMLLPQLAVVSLDAAVRAAWRRAVSHKKLLEWTTSAQTDSKINSWLRVFLYYLPAEALSVLLLLSPYNPAKLCGLIWCFFPVLVCCSDRPYEKKTSEISTERQADLCSDLSAMWQFYEDYAGEPDHYLPPDNVQFAPVHRICHRTSPTNIGMMLLSVLAARDFNIIPTDGLVQRLSRTLDSIEKLEKFAGNLYNWYDTDTLQLSSGPYLSSVDSGNFVCCLVALKEGLKEFRGESADIPPLVNRIDTLINQTNLGIFYNKNKNLFAIGMDPESGKLSSNHYDMLMSEARMLSYYAIAKRVVPKKHWRSLSRTMKRNNGYSGCVSFSGTFFEFFMPELLQKSKYGSLLYESLRYCVFCQKEHARKYGLPFGISESGYYSFDNNLNYQYKANGVPEIGLRKGLRNDYIVSPYSTYLSLQMDIPSACANLKKLKKYGTFGPYGQYEAIDFTLDTRNGAIVKSYMAHHVGMSILAISNVLNAGIMQKRFMRDNHMGSASELLEEKVLSGSVIYEDMDEKGEFSPVREKNGTTEYYDRFNASMPNVKLLSNGEYTTAVTDLGAVISMFQGIDVFARTQDMLRRPQGCYFAVADGQNTGHMTYLPDYSTEEEQSVEFLDSEVNFFSNTDELEMGMKIFLHKNLPCEFRQFAVKNTGSAAKKLFLLGYIEPVMMKLNDYTAHPAFAKLFLKVEYDADNKLVFFSRKERHSDKTVYCAVGFTQSEEFLYNFSREEVMASPLSASPIFENAPTLECNANAVPDPCVFLRRALELAPREQKSCTLFICSALSKDELYKNVAVLRRERFPCRENLPSPIKTASIEGRIASAILPQIFFKRRDCAENDQAIAKNTLPLRSLWEFGVSGDLPILLVEAFVLMDDDRISGYIKAYRALKQCGVDVDLVFIYEESTEYDTPIKNMLIGLIRKNHAESALDGAGGIHVINLLGRTEEVRTLFMAAAVHIAPRSMVRLGTPLSPFTPMRIDPVSPQGDGSLKKSWSLEREKVVIDQIPPVPWCHVLATPVFGTLLSSTSLGFTYAVNSRENKLTPWQNDCKWDNRGEMLLLKLGEKCYDLVFGARAEFSPEKAVYTAQTEMFRSWVTVEVSNRGCCKKISLELEMLDGTQEAQIAFYTEPVLDVNRENSRLIVPERCPEALLLRNVSRNEIEGYMALSASESFAAVTNREAFLSGRWEETAVVPQNHLCGAVIVRKRLQKEQKKRFEVSFCLSFGHTRGYALSMPSKFRGGAAVYANEITIETPDESLNHIFNTWLFHQALAGRIYARTGFYQNSGAWGFRDQLQDSCAVLLLEPSVAKRQILRACSAQFPEGDVLHWWHQLPGQIMRGVRTRYSDDLLWLPYTVCEYLEKTGDKSLLARNIPYCEGPLLEPEQHEIYMTVTESKRVESVYNHCVRALEYALARIGSHSLLKIGGGDWNDGYNGVGAQGRGESVWLSQFMILVLEHFAPVCEAVGEEGEASRYRGIVQELRDRIEESCWDGEWYLRAFFDDGTPMGSRQNAECRIDSLSQSFAILSGLPNVSRNKVALQNAYGQLVDEKNGIIRLFDPPFGAKNSKVGYVASYPPGIRENGGQYTHGAVWLGIALLQNGENEKGYQLIRMLNPAGKYKDNSMHGPYKNEPYYVSADIYTNPQCYGRGGWSIYTGAAAWYYRAIFEWLLGIKINGTLTVKPCIPAEWEGFSARLRYKNTALSVEVVRGEDCGIYDNGIECNSIALDGETHHVRVVIPPAQ